MQLVTRQIFSKVLPTDETYIDALFNPATLTLFWPGAESSLRILISKLHPNQIPHSSPFDLWNALFNALKYKGLWGPNKDTSTVNGRWKDCPNLDTWTTESEASLAKFLNDMATSIAGSAQANVARRWTAKYSTSCVFGHNAPRKPDLVLLDGSPSQGSEHGNWRVVRAVGEVKSNSSSTAEKEISERLAGESAAILKGVHYQLGR
jgi:hypothetical protein